MLLVLVTPIRRPPLLLLLQGAALPVAAMANPGKPPVPVPELAAMAGRLPTRRRRIPESPIKSRPHRGRKRPLLAGRHHRRQPRLRLLRLLRLRLRRANDQTRYQARLLPVGREQPPTPRRRPRSRPGRRRRPRTRRPARTGARAAVTGRRRRRLLLVLVVVGAVVGGQREMNVHLLVAVAVVKRSAPPRRLDGLHRLPTSARAAADRAKNHRRPRVVVVPGRRRRAAEQ